MPRTIIAADIAPGGYTGAGVTCTQTAADVANQNRTLHTGKELILAQNTHATLAKTVTITSIEDSLGRVEHITAESLAVGVMKMYGPFPLEGWRQTDGYIYYEGNDVLMLFTVIRLP